MEYLKFEHSQQIHAKRQLLYVEMSVLNSKKRLNAYQRLRKEELELKRNLRQKLLEIADSVSHLEQVFPKPSVSTSKAKTQVPTKKRKDLEMEIDEIKKKLALLQ